MMGLVYGVGINDADYQVGFRTGGIRNQCQAYTKWLGIMQRCYSERFHMRCPTYRGVTVCKEWHSFMAFKRWYDEHYIEGWHLDKDLLTDSREYGPSTCVFVPRWLNVFTLDHGAANGGCPIGVNWHKRDEVFQARCRNPIANRSEYLGRYKSPDKAHRAWLDRKVELAYQLKDWMDAIDRRIYFRVVEIIFNHSKKSGDINA